MPDQFVELVKIAGITTLITLLWAGSIAFTYWDTHRRRVGVGEAVVWLAVVALLPLIGFLIYLVIRVLTRIFHVKPDESNLKNGRETALKRPPANKNPLPTFLVADLTMQTIADPKEVLQTSQKGHEVAAKYIFTITSGAEQGKVYVVEDFPAKIGRGPEASIRLDQDLGVSRKHAELYQQNNSLWIRDLKSSHGTKVNGSHIDTSNLEPGDKILLGMTELVVTKLEVG